MYMHKKSDSRCVCTVVKKAARALSRVYDMALEPSHLTVAQLAILRTIQREGETGAPLSRLAEKLVMERTALYRALKPLEVAGWIEVGHAVRGRARHAALTAGGTRVLKNAGSDWERVQGMVVDRFGAERWADLQAALHELTLISSQLAASPLSRTGTPQ